MVNLECLANREKKTNHLDLITINWILSYISWNCFKYNLGRTTLGVNIICWRPASVGVQVQKTTPFIARRIKQNKRVGCALRSGIGGSKPWLWQVYVNESHKFLLLEMRLSSFLANRNVPQALEGIDALIQVPDHGKILLPGQTPGYNLRAVHLARG